MRRDNVIIQLNQTGCIIGVSMFVAGVALAFFPVYSWGTRVFLFVPAFAFTLLLAGMYAMVGGRPARYLLVLGVLWLALGVTIHYHLLGHGFSGTRSLQGGHE